MKGLDDGPDGLNDEAWERAFRKLPRVPHTKRQPIPLPVISIPKIKDRP